MAEINDFILLAKIDEDIIEIESSQGDLPNRIKKLKVDKENLEENKALFSSKEEERNKNQSTLTSDKEIYNQKLEKYKDQLYLVKNNKEYDALNSEIDVVKDELFQINESLKSIEIEKTEIEEKSKLNDSNLSECTEKLNKYNAMLDESISDYKDQYEKLKNQRLKITKKVNANILAVYNKMLDAKGHGMVSVLSDSCGSCFTVLPTQLVTEVKQNIHFKNCPSCNILLYYEE
tara:strand:- start:58 stop:756 length:699 start_codon:yes stop_codon:yes gene_type:complete